MQGRDREPVATAGVAPWHRDDHTEPSVFLPESLLREASRQRNLTSYDVPSVCLLDPDGDVVRHVRQSGGTPSPTWVCYHTDLYPVDCDGTTIGIVGNAVGAPFAVLIAEQLFASGCRFLVSVTSSGKVAPELPVPSVILIDRALRGEGTSSAYLPEGMSVAADLGLADDVERALIDSGIHVERGTTWTTDAPYRETATALQHAERAGALAVEMEAAALYAFATARQRDVICFAHVTNAMGVDLVDFEKGPTNGVGLVLDVAAAAVRGWQRYRGGQQP